MRWIVLVLSLIFLQPLYAADAADVAKQAYFLALSDIHFDPFVACAHAAKPCPLLQKLRKAPASNWSQILRTTAAESPGLGSDTDYALLASSLHEAHDVAETHHVRFVFVLGDFLAHNYRRNFKKYSLDKSRGDYQAFVRKTFTFLTQELHDAFPDVSVYSAVGNNDSYWHDYYSDPQGAFFSETGTAWSGLIKDAASRAALSKTFSTGGYYSVTIAAQPSLRLIMLNTTLFSYKAKGNNISKAAERELDWLHRELVSANTQHQKVMLAMHIPDAINVNASLRSIRKIKIFELWKPEYAQRYHAELKQFSPEIVAVLVGHLHTDWFQVESYDALHEIPVIGVPSISPVYGNAPAFKVIRYALPSLQLNDFLTYRYSPNKNENWSLSLITAPENAVNPQSGIG